MKKIWFCEMHAAPEGTFPLACTPRNPHVLAECGWAYEGSRVYEDSIEKYRGADRKPVVHDS